MNISRYVILVGSLLLALAARAQQQASELDVGVRTQIDRQKKIYNGWHAPKLQEATEHGKIYAILLMQPVNSQNKLVKPVDVQGLESELHYQLEKHGYHRVEPKHKPDILLTVIYGRSWLPNPYYTHDTDVDNMGPQQPDTAFPIDPHNPTEQVPMIAIDDPQIAARLAVAGVRDKATKATYEKLFILVRAWKYPTSPKDKPQVLWVTTMLVDDPDHRDLNVICKQMLEAGAPYFDKEIKGEEVDVYKPLPEGHVTVGTPEVVEPATPKTK